MTVHLRPAKPDDAAAFHVAHASIMASDGFALGLNYDTDEPFEAFVQRHDDFSHGRNLPEGHVPATFLVAFVNDEIVGRTSIRHALNEFLAAEGGHIGYGVLEQHRRRGYATEILQQSLAIARNVGIDRALLICDEDNVASATVIERCGGELVSRGHASDGVAIRRYEVPTENTDHPQSAERAAITSSEMSKFE